jgi:hypothetical protein
MNIDEWFKWPTNSSDPAFNSVVLVVIAMLGLLAITVSAFIAIPLAVGFALFKWAQWHARRQVPTAQIFADTHQRVIAANFPATDAFIEASFQRFCQAWKPELPIAPICSTMSNVIETLYEGEGLNNPLPPAPTQDTIAEGRYRDRLLSYMRKSEDAPGTSPPSPMR